MRLSPAAVGSLAAFLALALGAPAAVAGDEAIDLFSRDTVSGLAQARVGAADGETSWMEGGFGKGRFGDGARVELDGDLVWKPRLGWEWNGVVDLTAQPGQTHGLDVGEAFLRYKPTPRGPTRLAARIGLFYPDISREHDGSAWTVTDSLTPSAINSWVGEELKVAGLEGTATHAFDGQEVWATGAVFYYGDTAGTLLAFRGWSLSDVRSTADGRFGLPPLSAFMRTKQASFTTPVKELDWRPGWYAQLGWRRHGFSIDLTRYDNRGDRTSVSAQKEWSWQTSFWNLGLTWDIDARTSLRAQAMTGDTYMGYATPSVWADVEFQAGYLLLTRRIGDDALSARLDRFRVSDHTWLAADPNGEDGWAAMVAWRHALCPRADLIGEGLYVSSDTAARGRAGLDRRQGQATAQLAVRYRF